MSQHSIHLASGPISPLGDQISIELITGPNPPSVVQITWPGGHTTSVVPATFDQTVREITAILQYASGTYDSIEAGRGDRA